MRVDPRVAQVMSETIGIDMHNHVYPAGTEPHPQHLVSRRGRRSNRRVPNLGSLKSSNSQGSPLSVPASCWISRPTTSPAMRETTSFAGSPRLTRSWKRDTFTAR